MFGLDWWILLAATIFFNICWPPIMLFVALYFDNKLAQKLVHNSHLVLEKAESIEKRITTQIDAMNKKEEMLDAVAGMLEDYGKSMVNTMNAKQGIIEKNLQEDLDRRQKEMESKIREKGGGGGTSALEGLLAAGTQALLGG